MSNVFDGEEGRKWLLGLLKQGETTVVFTKVDGTERKLRCTLSESLIPAAPVVEGVQKTARKVSSEAQAVYDLDAEGWRSFRWDSIKEVIFG